MAKADIKTKQNEASVDEFLNANADEQQRADSFEVLEMMRRITGHEPKMWGPSIVGFGFRTIKSPSGREVDWLEVAFSPRKAALTLYGVMSIADRDEMLSKLGKHKCGGGCLYIKRLSDIDHSVLEKMITDSVENIRRDPSKP
jgi:hypothetical protein